MAALRSVRWLIFLGILIAGANSAIAQGQQGKVYAVLVLDTRGDGIGASVTKDGKYLEGILQDGLPEQQLHIDVLEGARANKKEVLDHLRTLVRTLEPDDAVLCFISSHGYTDKATGKHHLVLSGSGQDEYVARDEVRDALKSKARLAVLLTDASSGYPEMAPVPEKRLHFKFQAPPNPRAKGPRPSVALPGYRSLFFGSRGVVDINAAYDGTYALSDPVAGGTFTKSLYKTFQQKELVDNPVLSWPEVHIKIRLFTEEAYREDKKKYIASLPPGEWKPKKQGTRDQQDQYLLDQQETQSPRAFFLPGLILGVMARGTDGKGVKVIDMTADSPARKPNGLQIGDIIINVDNQAVATSNDWDRIMDPALKARKAQFKMKVLRQDRETDVQVDLAP